MDKFGKIIVYMTFVVSFSILVNVASGQSISATVKVPFSVTATFSGIPGDDLDNPYENIMGDTELDISGGSFGKTWRVDISKSISPTPDPNFYVEVMADGSNSKITGGGVYVEAPDDPSRNVFIYSNNSKNVNNLDLQHRVSQVRAVNVLQETYDITIYYTLWDES